MRTAELAKVAANAEKLHLKALAQRQAMRAVYGVVAALFLVGIVIGLHVLGYVLLRGALSAVWSLVILIIVDGLITAVCGLLALRSVPSLVEVEALEIRRQAVREMRTAVTMLGMVSPMARLLGGRRSTGLALGALATRLLARR